MLRVGWVHRSPRHGVMARRGDSSAARTQLARNVLPVRGVPRARVRDVAGARHRAPAGRNGRGVRPVPGLKRVRWVAGEVGSARWSVRWAPNPGAGPLVPRAHPSKQVRLRVRVCGRRLARVPPGFLTRLGYVAPVCRPAWVPAWSVARIRAARPEAPALAQAAQTWAARRAGVSAARASAAS